jgi:hypothetical protein
MMIVNKPMPSIFISGYPGNVGGANTELWHTVKLWRSRGTEGTLVPTWTADPAWKTRLETIGCATREVPPQDLFKVDGLPGSIVVSMCNRKFLAEARRFRELDCRIVWLGCMNWMFPVERLHYRRHGCFDRYVFQSRFQSDQLTPQLTRFGFEPDQGVIIRGAFDPSEFFYSPLHHAPGEIFNVGRIGRAETDKIRADFWKVLEKSPHSIFAEALGWSEELDYFIGRAPQWARTYLPGTVDVRQFLARQHCLVQTNQQAVENWPRVGLEAMAAGVPIIADDRGGWREMIRHGETGFLCRTADEISYRVAQLAYDEPLRYGMIRAARERLKTLADPHAIGAAWLDLFHGLEQCDDRRAFAGTDPFASKIPLAV